MGEAPLAQQAEAWLAYLEAARRASGHTLSAYRRDLRLLQVLLAERGVTELVSADTLALRQAVSALHRRGLAPFVFVPCPFPVSILFPRAGLPGPEHACGRPASIAPQQCRPRRPCTVMRHSDRPCQTRIR